MVLLATLGLAGSFLSACKGGCQGKPASDRGTPIATLGKQVIGEADFHRHLADTYPAEQLTVIGQDPVHREQALNRFLDQIAFLEKARRIGLPDEPRFKKAVELGELKLLAHLMTERNRETILRNSEVSPDAIPAYYEAHKHEFPVEIGFSMRWVLVYVRGNPAYPDQGTTEAKAKATAAKALVDLRRGIGWEAVAQTYSDDLGSKGKGGLIRHGQFGLYGKEVEGAVRTQPLGKPGEPIRSVFGYHVIEVVDRVVEPVPKPFDEVKSAIAARLGDEQSAKARLLFMTPIQDEIGFEVTEAGKLDTSLLNEDGVPQDTVLALVGKLPVLESDFHWFLKDVFLPSQRMAAYNRAGARQGLLRSYLDMLLLEAKARKDGLDRLASHLGERTRMEQRLLLEFMQEREKLSLDGRPGNFPPDRGALERITFDKLRAEAGLVRIDKSRRPIQ